MNDSSVRAGVDISCLRPRGHCDRPVLTGTVAPVIPNLANIKGVHSVEAFHTSLPLDLLLSQINSLHVHKLRLFKFCFNGIFSFTSASEVIVSVQVLRLKCYMYLLYLPCVLYAVHFVLLSWITIIVFSENTGFKASALPYVIFSWEKYVKYVKELNQNALHI
jgi:hypothetical protein